MAKKSLLPLLMLGGGVAAVIALSGKKADAATSTPVQVLPASPGHGEAPTGLGTDITVTGKSGKPWLIVQVGSGEYDVYSPAGTWGPHGELRVLRYRQAGSEKVLHGIASGVPTQVASAAMSDLNIKAPSPTVMTPPGRPPMPEALQREMTEVMQQLGVDSGGVVRGPASVEGVRHATELASRLDQAGYTEAGALIRGYATQATKMIPMPAASTAPAVPGVPPEMMARIQRALQLERDPAKLEALKQSLKTLPQSAQRDLLIGSLDALILQIRTQQAAAQAAVDIDEMLKQPGMVTSPGLPTASHPAPAPVPAAKRILKLTSPMMQGIDVRAWQGILIASGYTAVKPDGIYGPGTVAATKDWQGKRGLQADGIVGPNTLAKIGTPARATATPAPTVSVPTVSVPTGVRILKVTSPLMSGQDVKTWQGVLISSGYKNVKPDGVYGPATAMATKDWQSKRNIPADGIVGPTTLSRVGTPPTAPVNVPASPIPRPQPAPKSSREIAADAMVTHLKALQAKYGAKGSKGRQDLTLVKRFQREVGGVEDGLPGANTMIAAARTGIGSLPKVMYWNKSPALATQLTNYRNALNTIAANASAAGMPVLATQITASAAAEKGEAA